MPISPMPLSDSYSEDSELQIDDIYPSLDEALARFKVGDVMGKGSFGEVMKARYIGSSKKVAIKIVHHIDSCE
eukprot:CAMPEP_0170499420 /NCGR_PEP_ID=MMETSP0208-20121228/31349_1 /TAXON_ID=197538 /ORGANISM="Strombidium inclinatum, Strain S3" /LENGTH=72 /DNA_ID=CAMNT_0010776959 /DNA_START=56 /DNA_END=277 /DNA_ORIENTATION=+